MSAESPRDDASLIGRTEELDQVRNFVDGMPQGPSAFVIAGSAGFGKTTLWNELLRLAAERGIRICPARPSEPDRSVSMLGLWYLFDPFADGIVTELPAPQRR